MHHRALRVVTCLLFAAGLAACAAAVKTAPVTFSAAAAGGEIKLDRGETINLPTGYTRVLLEGSRWLKMGTVPQGAVYRAAGTVFTIEGRNVHEAYLVLSPSRELVGFYLPGELNISMLSTPVPLQFKENP